MRRRRRLAVAAALLLRAEAAPSVASGRARPSLGAGAVAAAGPARPSRRRRIGDGVGVGALAHSASSPRRALVNAAAEATATATATATAVPRGGYAHVDATAPHDPSADVPVPPRPRHREHPRRAMYGACLAVVSAWVVTGTLAYARMNGWPLATSFFYAVDAGMSIGFCTDVAERNVRSRAFSVLFILLGASVVGGALAVLVADVLEGASRAVTMEWRTALERDAFRAADADGDGVLSYGELGRLLDRSGYRLPEGKVLQVCRGLDRDGTGRITYGQFLGTFRGLGPLIREAERRAGRRWKEPWFLSATKKALSHLEVGQYRMFLVFFLWVGVGVVWGINNQKWDPITATHFAVSALATGGLTAPPVNEDGVLPSGVALFVGSYCLAGIPLFYLAMGHFAKMLIQGHLAEAEKLIIETPLRPYEYQFARTLCSTDDVVHLSDFIVLHFLRRGLTDFGTIRLLKGQFEALDGDGDGVLSFEEATAGGGLDDKDGNP